MEKIDCNCKFCSGQELNPNCKLKKLAEVLDTLLSKLDFEYYHKDFFTNLRLELRK